MRISKLLCMVAAGSLFVQSVDAQTRGGQTANPNAAQGQPGGRGGRGGPGGGGPGGGGPGGMMGGMRGMMGGGGMMGGIATSPAFLLRSEAVQKEIKLTSDQKDKLKKAEEKQNDSRQKMFEDMRNQAQRGQQGQQGQQGQPGGRGGRGGFDFTAMRDAMEKLAKESETELSKILTADQRKRLAEIALQVEGPVAILNREDIAKRLNLQQQQITKMNQVKQQADQKQQEMRTQMMASMGFGGRGGPGGPGGGGFGRGGAQPGQAGAPNQPQQGGRGGAFQGQPQQGGRGGAQPGQAGAPNQPQQGGRGGAPNMTAEERQKRADDMRKSFDQMREQSAKLRDQLDAAILKLLTKRQADAFKKMNGEKFDVDSIMETMQMGQGGPGRGGRGPTSVD